MDNNVLELLNAESNSSSPEYWTIDPETRVIETYNDTLGGVESDTDTTRKYIKCPRYVGDDNFDLMSAICYINYRNAAGEIYPYHIDDMVEIEDGYVKFSWLLHYTVTYAKGDIDFIFCAKTVDEKGVITKEWNTTLAQVRSLEGLEPELSAEEREKVDILSLLLGIMPDDWEKALEDAIKKALDGRLDDVIHESTETIIKENTETIVKETATEIIKQETETLVKEIMADVVTEDGSVVSSGSNYAVCYEWSDGNVNLEDRIGLFVQLTDSGSKISAADSTSKVLGVTTDNAAFIENHNIKSKYTSYVCVSGVVTVIDDGTCEVGKTCMPNDNGYATLSSNDFGYSVISRIDDTHILISVKDNDDTIQRIGANSGSSSSDESDKMDKVDPTGSGSFSLNRAEGTDVGLNSVAIGSNVEATASFSYAEGAGTKSTGGDGSHAEGWYTQANGPYSHAEGHYSTTKSRSKASHAEGFQSHAGGGYYRSGGIEYYFEACHAEGFGTTASGSRGAHAEGEGTKAISTNSVTGGNHAEGYYTESSGGAAHAEGYRTIASGSVSHAEGRETIASQYCQHVQGKYNVEDTNDQYVHIVGWGDDDTNRKNIHTIDKAGNAWYYGDVRVRASNDAENSDYISIRDLLNRVTQLEYTIANMS